MKRFSIFFTLTILITAVTNNTLSQINTNGIPFTTNYSPQVYQAAEQNWCILQDNRGLLYVGNNDHGLLEYDGSTWRKIPTKNKSIVRSMAIDDNGNIFVGCVGDVGYLQSDINGQQHYTSLYPSNDSIKFTDIWKTYCINNNIYYCGFDYIIKYNTTNIKTFKLSQGTFFSFHINENLFIGNFNEGLKKLLNDSIVTVKGSEFFSKKGIYTANALGNKILFGTGNAGIFKVSLTENELNPQIEIFSNNYNLIENQLYSTINYKSHPVYGTIHNGLYILNDDGSVINHFNKKTGLQDETILCIYSDDLKNIWLGLNNGITKTELNGAFKKYSKDSGIEGNILDICEFNDHLFVGTSSGVYYSKSKSFSEFHKLNGVDIQTWKMLSFNKKLLIGTINGLFEVADNLTTSYIDKNIQLDGINYIQDLSRSAIDTNIVLVALANGSFTIGIKDNQWKRISLNPIKGVDIQQVYDNNFNTWYSTIYEGLIRKNNIDSLSYYSSSSGLPSNKGIYIQTIKNITLFGTSQGIYQFDSINEQFYPYHEFSEDYHKQKIGIFRMNEDPRGNIWLSCYQGNKRWVERLLKDSIGNYSRDTIPFKRLPNEQFDAIYHDDDNNITWLGSSSGLYSFDNNFKRNYHTPYNVLVRKVVANQDSTLFHGTNYKILENGKRVPGLNQPKELKPVLTYDFNDISFEFASPYFEEEQKTEYSYLLDGDMKHWSHWNKESKAVFTNLREGKYTFKIKAKNIYGIESKIATYEFTIKSPWYRTILAYTIYAILFLVALYLFIKLYTRKLRLEKEKLEGIVKERTSEIVSQKQEIEKQAEELQRSNDKLVELDRFKQSLTGMIVHDLKNPLNAIINTTENQLTTYKNRVQQSGRQMLNMVMNILDVYKYEDSQMTVDKISNNAYNIVKAALREVDFLAVQKNIKITNNVNTVIGIAADKEILERVFINFLSNAIKYTANNDSININAEVDLEQGSVLFKIVDTGIGIEKQFLPKVFDLFGQVDVKKSGGVRSTGLGLTFCKMAIEAHGGQIGVDSLVGVGTTFWFTMELTKSKQSIVEKKEIEQETRSSVFNFSDVDKKYLKPFIKRFKEHLVYESTQIEIIIQEIDTSKSEMISKWIEELNNCLYAMNEEKYQVLLNMIE